MDTKDPEVIFDYYDNIKKFIGDWFDIFEDITLLMEHHVNKTTLDVDIYEEKIKQIIGTIKYLIPDLCV